MAPRRAPRPRVDNATVKALARALRWRKELDTGLHATLLDMTGTPIGDTRPSPGLPPGALAAARALAAAGGLVSPLVEDPASGGHALLLAKPGPAAVAGRKRRASNL